MPYPKYDENYKKLMEIAISNAKKLKNHHELTYDGAIKAIVESNPYTNLWELIGYMENLERN